jgi:hypothetical protein
MTNLPSFAIRNPANENIQTHSLTFGPNRNREASNIVKRMIIAVSLLLLSGFACNKGWSLGLHGPEW